MQNKYSGVQLGLQVNIKEQKLTRSHKYSCLVDLQPLPHVRRIEQTKTDHSTPTIK